MDTQAGIVNHFNEGINNRDIEALAGLMTTGHVFIDPANQRVSGKDGCLVAWKGFFSAFPDYRNIFESVEIRDDVVIITGRSTCSDARLDGPAIWTAKLEGSRIAEWRVYDDNPDVRRLLGLDL